MKRGGRRSRDEAPSLSPSADYRSGEITLSEAACRYVELCNGIEVQDVVDHFDGDDRESKAIREAIWRAATAGRFRSEGTGRERLFYGARARTRRVV